MTLDPSVGAVECDGSVRTVSAEPSVGYEARSWIAFAVSKSPALELEVGEDNLLRLRSGPGADSTALPRIREQSPKSVVVMPPPARRHEQAMSPPPGADGY